MTHHQALVTGHGLFIAGTDTGAGKTLVASTLLRIFARSGLRAVGMKPVATGCCAEAHDRANEDVVALLAASNVHAAIDLINPYCFEPAIAPHLAAQQAGCAISLARIRQCYLALAGMADRVIVEGAGGLLVPLSPAEDWRDLVELLDLSVILVVGMRLGCLNHALLTAEAIGSRGLPFAGWVANRIDPDMLCFEDNVETLRSRLPAPLIGILPFAPNDAQAFAAVDPGMMTARKP